MSTSGAHILVFPYPVSSHIIPILDLTHLLLTRSLNVTVVIIPACLPLLDPLLSSHPRSSLQTLVLTPPDHVNPSSIGLVASIRALSELSNPITQWFHAHPSPPVAIISGMFLGWTHQLATNLGIPRVAFWSTGAIAASSFYSLWRDLPKVDDPDNDNCILSLLKIPYSPKYPWWQIGFLYRHYKVGDPDWEFFRNGMLSNAESWGNLFNSFTELERVYFDHLKKEMGHDRVWAIGPLLPDDDDSKGPSRRGGSSSVPTHEVLGWLDSKANDSVVYICFGSKWTITHEQVGALAAALESSRVHFVWTMKEPDFTAIPDGFEDRVKDRAFIVKGWAPQVTILRHRAVGVFVTHCGWNSVLEGISTGVLLLTWPLAAEQFTNAKLLVDQLGIAARFCEDGNRVVPNSTELAQLLAESVCESGLERRARVKELRDAAMKALKLGGSSSRDLDMLIQRLCELQHKKN